MKIRSDYVSNSSSSSFMIVGQSFDEDKILELGEKHGLASEDDDIWDVIRNIGDAFGLSYSRGIDNYYGEWCIGLRYGSMNDSETKKEFENRISKKLEELTGEKCNVSELVDGGMDS